MRSSLVRSFSLLVLLSIVACDSGPVAPVVDDGVAPALEARGRGKKPKPKDDPPPEPDPDPQPAGSTWQLEVADDYDPLWRFTRTGDEVLLQTDPTVTSWGTDYWGYWSDPFPIEGENLEYTIGLTHTTYTFVEVAGGAYDVTKTLVVQPYNGGDPTTTVTHVGVFGPVD